MKNSKKKGKRKVFCQSLNSKRARKGKKELGFSKRRSGGRYHGKRPEKKKNT